jgi:hypothetical protein
MITKYQLGTCDQVEINFPVGIDSGNNFKAGT